MNEAVALALRDRGVLVLMLAGSLAIHATGFVLFKVSGEVDLPGFVRRTKVQMISPSLERQGKLQAQFRLVELLDSSLMALPSGPGFSGRMWGRGIPAARQTATWDGEPSFLDAARPGAFPTLLPPVPLDQAVQADPTRWPEAPAELERELRPELPRLDRSVFRLLGPLADRAVVKSPALARIATPVALRPTTVRVAVAGDGAVRYVSLERGCGNETVDAQALGWARQLRFEPVAAVGDELAWGVVRFLWATELPGAVTGGGAK